MIIGRVAVSPSAAVRISCSPSPQSSPLGRGSILPGAVHKCCALELSQLGEAVSLSPRERVGVRGKKAFKFRAALEIEVAE